MRKVIDMPEDDEGTIEDVRYQRETGEEFEEYFILTEDGIEEADLEEEDDRPETQTKSEAEEEYRQIVTTICKGRAELVPDPTRKAKEVCGFYGLGEKLNGGYYVDEIENRFSRRGYEQFAEVRKLAFGDSYEPEGEEERREEMQTPDGQRPEPM